MRNLWIIFLLGFVASCGNSSKNTDEHTRELEDKISKLEAKINRMQKKGSNDTERYGIKNSKSDYEPENIRKLKLSASNGGVEPLAPQYGNSYTARNLVDGNPATGWAIPLDDYDYDDTPIWGPILHVSGAKKIDYIMFTNGYAKSKDIFNKNTRASWVQIYRPIPPDTGYPDPEDILYEGPLKDISSPQKLKVNPRFDFRRPIGDFVVTFAGRADNGYYYGNKYNDLVISEIEFWGN